MLARSASKMAGPTVARRCSLSNRGSLWSSITDWTHQQRLSRTLLRRHASAAGDHSEAPASSYKIAIPTFDRSHTLEQRTLSALQNTGVDTSNRVDIFVASEQEAEKYSKALTPGFYANIVIGTLGIGKQRDFILGHYGPGADIVMMDDDIQWFMQQYEDDLDMHRAIQKGFELSRQHDCHMWGISNSSNGFFLKQTYSVGWCFFQGAFMAFRVRDCMRLAPEFHSTMEDIQYSLMHCELDGKLLRLNGLGLKARPYGKEPGGLQTFMSPTGRQQSDARNKAYLYRRYGRFIRAWPEGKPHPALRRSPEHEVHPLRSLI